MLVQKVKKNSNMRIHVYCTGILNVILFLIFYYLIYFKLVDEVNIELLIYYLYNILYFIFII